MPLNVLVAGGTGLVGVPLVQQLCSRGDTITVLGRSHERIAATFGTAVHAATWDGLTPAVLEGVDIVINLCGENVGAGMWWTADSMRVIRDSRLATTTQIATALASSTSAARLLNASGVSIYGDSAEAKSEDSPVCRDDADYLAGVSVDWEAAALAQLPPERVVFLRFGIVVARGGGALGKMEMPFRVGLGGRLGPGTQAMSWISLADAVAAVVHLIDAPAVSGPVNIVANHCMQIEFASALAAALWRPCLAPAPSFALRLLLGKDMAQALLLSSHRVLPKRLAENGFVLADTDLAATLKRLYA